MAYPLACARSVPHHVAYCLWKYGSREQKEKLLPSIFKAEVIVSECISEPEVGSDADRISTRTVRDGDSYIMSGEKRFTASVGVADVFLVFAITSPDVHPTRRIGVFIVEKDRGNIHPAEEFSALGWKGLRIVSELVFNGVRVPRENLVGQEDQGFDILMDMLDQERVVVAGGVIGPARICLEIARRYSEERMAFHRQIRAFEGVSFKIGDLALMIEAASLLRIKAARMIDRDLPAVKETAFKVTTEAIQILGGIGYTDKYLVERHFRDACGFTIGVGISEIMRLVIQREVYKEAGLSGQ